MIINNRSEQVFVKLSILLLILMTAACAPHILTPKGSMRVIPEVQSEDLEQVYKPRRIAMLVGINEFNDDNWRPLNYAEKDASAMASLLRDGEKGGFDEVILLTGSSKTSRQSIMDSFDYLSKINISQHDTVLIYFSTHGTLENDEYGNLSQYLVLMDTQFDDITGTAINVRDLQQRFMKLRSRRKVLILATCHSGSGKSVLNPVMSKELSLTKAGFFVKPLQAVSEASVILSACAWGETAREDDKLKHDIYTHFFMEALEGFDPNQDGAVSVSEAHDYAREKTYYYTRGKQRPTAMSDILGSDPIILAGKVKGLGKPILFSYSNSLDDVEIYVDGRHKGSLPGSMVVNPGVHHIKLVRKGGRVKLFDRQVKFVAGKRVNAEELIKMVQADQTVGLGVSYRSFISQEMSADYFAPVLTYGLNYGRKGPWQKTRFETGLYAGNTSETLNIEGVDWDVVYTRADLESALLWQYNRGKLSLAGGPVVGLAYLSRDLPEEFARDSQQSRVTGLVGPMFSLEINPTNAWIMGLGGEINFAHITIDSTGALDVGYAATIFLKYRL